MDKKFNHFRHVFMASALPAIAFAATPAFAAGVQAGTSIENTATATYTNGTSVESVTSNTVSVVVDEILDVAVASLDGGNVSITNQAVLTFQITNSGNGNESFNIDIDTAVPGDGFDPDFILLAYDSNFNGMYDSGTDTVLTPGASSPIMAPDENLLVFAITALPLGTIDAAIADVKLTANAVTGSGSPGTLFSGQGDSGSDAVVGSSTAQDQDTGNLIARLGSVDLIKSATVSDPFGGNQSIPGAAVTYSLVANFTGTGTVSALTIADNIPVGTTYQPGSLTLDGSNLTDSSDGDSGEASASGIEVILGDFSGTNSYTIQFTVEIN